MNPADNFAHKRSGLLSAFHYHTGQPVEVRWQNGIITSLEPSTTTPTESLWIAPGLVDLQINGFAGIDFQQDELTAEELLTSVRGLRTSGCTQFFLTLVTDVWTRLLARVRRIRALRSECDELRDAIAGWHIEGPFLSPEPGYCGAHNPAVMCDPALEKIRELRSATENDPLLLTLAPERTGAFEAIALAVSLGMKVSLGHTNASRESLGQAVQAGATGFTHLGNACPKELDRHDNILWRVFETPGLLASLIPDKIHVSPPFFRLAHKLLGAASLCYTTDAMSAAGAPPGRYRLGALELEVGADQIVRQPGRTNFAGSALRPIDGVFRASEMLSQPWREVWDRSSTIPAKWIGLRHELQPGHDANFCLLRLKSSGQLDHLTVCWKGELITT